MGRAVCPRVREDLTGDLTTDSSDDTDLFRPLIRVIGVIRGRIPSTDALAGRQEVVR